MALPTSLDTERSVLFLGSGFSAEASAISGSRPPLGIELANILADALGQERGKYSLQQLADAVQRDVRLDLFEIVRPHFIISNLSANQREILRHRWMRIYTTNYDDTVELAYQKNDWEINSFNYDDPKPLRVPRGAIIHMHGAIRKATEENIHQQLVLGTQSYVRQFFGKSPWYDEFVRDLKFSESCFFLGYALSDPHITALIAPENAKSRTFFIVKGAQDPLFLDQIERYGELHEIELKGFANLCRTLPRPTTTTDPRTFKALKLVDPFKDRKAILPPTPLEVRNLVTFGTFDSQRCLSRLPRAEYAAPRTDTAKNAAHDLHRVKTLLVHSQG